MNKGTSKTTLLYKAGDLIFRSTALGSPGPGWLNVSTTQTIPRNSALGRNFAPFSVWTPQTSQFGTNAIRAVAFGNGTWVAGGAGGALRTSTDAINWNTQTSTFGTSQIQAVAFGNGTWVAGGAGGAIRNLVRTYPTLVIGQVCGNIN